MNEKSRLKILSKTIYIYILASESYLVVTDETKLETP